MVIIPRYEIAHRLFVFDIVSAHFDPGSNLSFHQVPGLRQETGGERKVTTHVSGFRRLFLRSALYAACVAGLFWSLRRAEASLVAPRLAQRVFDMVGGLDWMCHRVVRL